MGLSECVGVPTASRRFVSRLAASWRRAAERSRTLRSGPVGSDRRPSGDSGRGHRRARGATESGFIRFGAGRIHLEVGGGVGHRRWSLRSSGWLSGSDGRSVALEARRSA